MEVLSNDMLFGNFRISDYGLIVGSFSYSEESEDDIGMNLTTIEEFLGDSPIPVYIGGKYTDKLQLRITLVKNPCVHDCIYFSEKDCRSILRTITGKREYQWLKLINQEFDEDLWYRAKVNNIVYRRMNEHVVGIILDMECDSHFAWSKEYNIKIHVDANKCFYVYNNTDDLENYVYPVVSIAPLSPGDVSLTNITDNNWNTEIKNIGSGEKITIDSAHQIISSNSPHDLLLNDFNLGWMRLIPDKNEYICDSDAVISLKFRVPRKVGVVYEQEEQYLKQGNSPYSDTHAPIPIQKIESLFVDNSVPGEGSWVDLNKNQPPEYELYSETHIPITIPKIENVLKD